MPLSGQLPSPLSRGATLFFAPSTLRLASSDALTDVPTDSQSPACKWHRSAQLLDGGAHTHLAASLQKTAPAPSPPDCLTAAGMHQFRQGWASAIFVSGDASGVQ